MPQSRILRNIINQKNGERKIERIYEIKPDRTDAEVIGGNAGRIYLREGAKLVAVTLSSEAMRAMADQIDVALVTEEETMREVDG